MRVLRRRVDFAGLIQTIEAHGTSQGALARQLHVNRATVWKWAHHGVEPRFAHGHALLNIAARHDPGAALLAQRLNTATSLHR